MDDNSTPRKSNRQQLLRYLLRPPLVFLLGYAIAIVLTSFANKAAQGWLDPVSWGCVVAIVYLAQPLPFSRRDPDYSFGPKPPNDRRLALVFALSTALYTIIVCELLRSRQRESIEKALPNALIILLAVLAPIAISFSFHRRYKAYKEPSSD